MNLLPMPKKNALYRGYMLPLKKSLRQNFFDHILKPCAWQPEGII
jgi:hypothetical protein